MSVIDIPPSATKSRVEPEIAIGSIVARYAVYLTLIVGALLSLPLFAGQLQRGAFRDGGMVENVQAGVLATCGLMLGLGAWRFANCRGVLTVMSALATIGTIREFDYFFDKVNRTITWKGPVVIVVGLAALGLWQERRRFAGQLRWILAHPAVGILWTALAVLFFGELVGSKLFLQSVLGEFYQTAVKRLVEELVELFGYLLVFVGSIEVLIRAATCPPSDAV